MLYVHVFVHLANYNCSMESIGIAELRKNMKSTLTRVIEDVTEILINRPGGEDVVLVSLSEYNSMIETMHLLDSENNRKRLKLGMEQIKHGKTTKIDIDAL